MPGFRSAELQTEIFSLLNGDVTLAALVDAVYDAPPGSATLPYIAFGDGAIEDNSSKSDAGSAHSFTIDVWADGTGRMAIKQIMDRVHALLHDASLSLASGNLTFIRFQSSEDMRDEENAPTIRHHGIMKFTALVRG